eukprot:15468732-Alexandrium_andersonii.AAC.1
MSEPTAARTKRCSTARLEARQMPRQRADYLSEGICATGPSRECGRRSEGRQAMADGYRR